MLHFGNKTPSFGFSSGPGLRPRTRISTLTQSPGRAAAVQVRENW